MHVSSFIDTERYHDSRPAAGINNALRAMMGQVASWVSGLYAVASDVLAGTSATKAITPDALADAQAYQSLSIVSSAVSPNLATGVNFTVTLTGNITLNNIANLIEGYSGMIEFIQDGTGGRTVSKPSSGSKYYGPNGFPDVDGSANSRTLWTYQVRSSSVVYLFPTLSMSAS